MNKKRMQIVLPEKSVEILEQLKEELNISSTSDAVSFVLGAYMNLMNEERERKEQTVSLLKEQRKISNKIDKSAQILIEMMNSSVINAAARDFYSTEEMPSAIYTKSSEHVKTKIAYIKQINDSRKGS